MIVAANQIRDRLPLKCATGIILQVLQREQEAEIARLEKEANDMRVKHSEAVQKIKAKFIAEKCAFQKEADGKISELTREANLVRIYLRNPHKKPLFISTLRLKFKWSVQW